MKQSIFYKYISKFLELLYENWKNLILPSAPENFNFKDLLLSSNNWLASDEELLHAINSIINGNESTLTNGEVTKAKQIISKTLVKYAIRSNSLSESYNFAHQWRCKVEFIEVLKLHYLKKPDFIKPLLQKISKIYIDTPEEFILTSERERFKHFFTNFSSDTNIASVWRLDFLQFPTSGSKICLLNLPLPEDVNTFVELTEKIKLPSIISSLLQEKFKLSGISNTFLLKKNNKADKQLFKDLFLKIPSCINRDEPQRWNRSVLLPVLFGFIIAALDDDGLSLLPEKELIARADASFVAYHLLCHLRETPSILSTHWSLIRGLENKMNWLKRIILKSDHRPYSDISFPNESDVVESFLETGIISENTNGKPYLNHFLTQVFLENPAAHDKIESFIEGFEKLLAIEDMAFHTTHLDTELPADKHKEIANLYAQHKKPSERWYKTWLKLSSARHRLCYFPNDSLDAAYKVKFCLIVGIAIVDTCIKQKKYSQASKVLAKVWHELLNCQRERYFVFLEFVERAISLCLGKRSVNPLC